nr:MAG TPA: hypothetical protein [Caudoviricetes sp.]
MSEEQKFTIGLTTEGTSLAWLNTGQQAADHRFCSLVCSFWIATPFIFISS